jgi:RimJ/RimL family protein N-acetyltransferase
MIKLAGKWTFLCLKLPPLIRGVSVSLRRLAILDAPFLQEVVAESGGDEGVKTWYRRFWKGLDVWWWMRSRYVCVYLIKARAATVGLIGLYDLTLGEQPRAALTLIIPTRHHRGKGYAKEACSLLLGRLAKGNVLKIIEVILVETDPDSLSLWESLGFTPVIERTDRTVLFISLANQ